MAQRLKTDRSRRRVFTLAEAQRSLPLVRRIVGDIVEDCGNLAALIRQRNRQQERDHRDAAPEYDRRAREAVKRINELIEEVHAIGCELKDWETGLVDFRAEHQDRTVYLCWRLGEERISHWHELHAGVAGRRPIDAAFRRDADGKQQPRVAVASCPGQTD